MRMNRILITGGAGFIGFHLAKNLLKTGEKVDIFDNFSRGIMDTELEKLKKKYKDKFNIISGDLLNNNDINEKLSMKKYEYIYHFAAIMGVKHVLKKPFEVLKKNAALTINAVEFAKNQHNLKRFIFASTSEVYAGTLKFFNMQIPTPECTPLAVSDLNHPRTSYMLSKIYGEALCHNSDLPFSVIRPHNFYGPRMGLSHVIPELLMCAYKSKDGELLDVFSVEHKRSFCYIDDAVKVIIKAIENPKSVNETLNIGVQEPEISIYKLAEVIIGIVGKNLIIKPKRAHSDSPTRRCPNIKKAIDLSSVKPNIDLVQGIKRTYKWYIENVFETNGKTAI